MPDKLPRLQTAIPGPRSKKLAGRLKKIESPDTTYFYSEFPVFWNSARGSNVEDADGNRYVDFNAGFGVASVGHSHPRIVRVLREQSARLIHGMGDVHPTELKLRLGEEIVKRAPKGHSWKVIFGTTGSDAVEAALKTAAIATGKSGLIVFEGGYHGLSLGALSATLWPKFRQGLKGTIAERAVKFPYPASNVKSQILDRITSFLASAKGKSKRIGAMLIEPILGRGGIVLPAPGALAQLRRLCGEHGILLICDEIYTGFGRTGAWFECLNAGVVPDLIACGKSLGGGMPISVCIGKSEIMDAWGTNTGEARHTSTFLGHPLACACALETLKIVEDERLLSRVQKLGEQMANLLRENPSDIEGIAEVRGRGMMIGVEIVNPKTGAPDPARAWRVVVDSLKKGVILLTSGMAGNVISITPPLPIADKQVEYGIEVIVESLKTKAS